VPHVANLQEFENATREAAHGWKLVDVTNAMPEWLASLEQHDAYFAEPEFLPTAPSVVMHMERGNAANLRQQLISAGTPVKGLFTVMLLSRRYNASSHPTGLYVELLDYRLEQ
jgi:hypothetical protein